ncbi:DUF2202 domain-containing protein [Planctomycetota bacterium]
MKRLSLMLMVILTILTVSLTVLAEPQQDRQCDQQGNTQSQDGCQQNSSCPRDKGCEATSGQQGRCGRQGHEGRGRGWGLNQEVIPLTEAEIPLVKALREEEKLARDVYLILDELYLAPVFANIARSEQRHMDAVGRVIEVQGLEDPVTDPNVGVFTNPVFADLYQTLTAEGATDYVAALKVGATIEEIDIKDLHEALAVVTNPQVIWVFENLLRGSYNHLRAFTSVLETEGVTYAPQILSPEVYDAILHPTMNGNRNQQGQGAGGRQGQGRQGA